MGRTPAATAVLAARILLLGMSPLVLYYSLKWLLKQMDPLREQKDRAAALSRGLLARLRPGEAMQLTEYEMLAANGVVDPSQLTVTWRDVGGLDSIVAVLKETIVLPFTRPDIFNSSSPLLHPPSGVLLFGPPGCGKTMLAKALAKEAGCCFINLQPSAFMDKWYGESQKMIEGIFSLAHKLQPTLIFIDEIDAFLRERSSSDHESTAMTKAQFMSLWDGFATDRSSKVVIVGATNRPGDVDAAILRRMPRTCHVGLPDKNQRRSILNVVLGNQQLDASVDMDDLAERCAGYSGSDLKELCRNAALRPVRDYLATEHEMSRTAESGDAGIQLRPLCAQDFEEAMCAVEHPATNSSGKRRQSQLDTTRTSMTQALQPLHEPQDDESFVDAQD